MTVKFPDYTSVQGKYSLGIHNGDISPTSIRSKRICRGTLEKGHLRDIWKMSSALSGTEVKKRRPVWFLW